MNDNGLRAVAEQMLSQAQELGFVVPRDVRAGLNRAGLADRHWKEVLALVHTRLRYRHGRYYYVTPAAAHMRDRAGREHQHHLAVQQAVRRLMGGNRAGSALANRRRYRRSPLGCIVDVLTADRRELRLLCTDISLGGIRLVGSRSLQGQTVSVRFPGSGSDSGEAFRVHILWSLAAGDDLFQNGGVFLELATEANMLKIVGPD